MKFEKYILNEATKLSYNIDEIVEAIKNDCKPYLKDLGGLYKKHPFLSGRNNNPYDFSRGTVRKDRMPKDTPVELHDIIDNWFYKRFGIKARSNSIFCGLSLGGLSQYGLVKMIFPIGKYTAISSSNIIDLFSEIEDAFTNLGIRAGSGLKDDWHDLLDEDKQTIINSVIHILENGDYKTNGYKTTVEYMVNCKDYYMATNSMYSGIGTPNSIIDKILEK